MAGYGIRAFLIAQSPQPDRQGLRRRTTPSSTTAMCAIAFATNDERTAQADLRRARHRDRTARAAQLCRPPAGAVAWPRHGRPPGDGPPAADAGRGDAAAAERRAGAGLRPRRRSGRKKLRYYEDRNFTIARACRRRRWRRRHRSSRRAPTTGAARCAASDARLDRRGRSRSRPAETTAAPAARHPGLPEQRTASRQPTRTKPISTCCEDDDAAADKRAMDDAAGASPRHAMQHDRDDDLLPAL